MKSEYRRNKVFDIYKAYLAIKTHFSSAKYDIFRYNGNLKVSEDSLYQRKDVEVFRSLSKKYSTDQCIDFFLANMVCGDTNCGLYSSQSHVIYLKWKKQIDSLSTRYETDLKIIVKSIKDNNLNVDDLIKVTGNEHPLIFKMFMGGKIISETMIILNMIIEYFGYINDRLTNDFMWKDFYKFAMKYEPFINVDVEKYGRITEKTFARF